MFKGFYNLTSGMLTHGRTLDVIANNMTNVSTAGFKADQHTATTFGEAIWSRVNGEGPQRDEIGSQSYGLASREIATDYAQGVFDETALPLDFAIEGDGFFAIETAEGRAYTRAGNFSLDEEGYLCLPGQGRVLDDSGAPLLLATDRITADAAGTLFSESGESLGKLGLFSFEDVSLLRKNDRGLFITDAQPAEAEAAVRNGWVERSNVDLIKQMTDMMSTQRAYQSAAQLLKMYDQLMSKATNEVGRL